MARKGGEKRERRLKREKIGGREAGRELCVFSE